MFNTLPLFEGSVFSQDSVSRAAGPGARQSGEALAPELPRATHFQLRLNRDVRQFGGFPTKNRLETIRLVVFRPKIGFRRLV